MGILPMPVTGRGKIDLKFKIQDSTWGHDSSFGDRRASGENRFKIQD